MLEKLLDLCEYLSTIGYHIPPNFMEEFFILYGKTEISQLPLEDMGMVLAPMIVKSKEEDRMFPEDFKYFFSKKDIIIKAKESQQKKHQKEVDSIRRKNNELKKEKEHWEKELESTKKESLITPRKRRAIEKKRKSLGEEWKKLIGEDEKKLDAFYDKMEKEEASVEEAKKIDEILKKLLKKAIFSPKYEELMEHISKARKLIKNCEKRKKQEDQIKKNQNRIKEIDASIQKNEDSLRKLEEEWRREVLQIKERSYHHRAEFTEGKNAVQSTDSGVLKSLDKNFEKITAQEKEEIKQYIRENTRKFRTKMIRNMRSRHDRKINMEETCKKSCGTDGIPMELSFRRERPQRTKIFLLLDVSGSCKHASEMMLLFIYYMREVFPGGCSAYAFTNQLYDLTDFFGETSGDRMAKAALEAIPRSGAYSDYNRPFRTLYEEHMAEIDRNTLLFVIGDARNNKNASGEEYFKAMARKAKKVFWMNTDDLEKWDQGDSIISTYAPYTHILKEVKTPAQLIGFLTEIKG